MDRTQRWLQTEAAKRSIKERKLYAEWVFAEAKFLHGLDRMHYRGLEEATIQGLMTALVQNMKKLLNHTKKIYEVVSHCLARSVHCNFSILSYA